MSNLKKQIIYSNITYCCDNFCKFCFLDFRRKGNTDIQIADFENYLSEFRHVDRIILNGGEPLLHQEILKLIKIAKKYTNELVIYSNGNMLSNINFAKLLFSSNISRITLPIHGNEAAFDLVTQNPSAYSKVMQALDNIKVLGVEQKVEIKFIVSKYLASKKYDIKGFLEKYNFQDIVICGQVNTKNAKINKFTCDFDDSYYNYFSEQIQSLIGKYNIKIYDVYLCRLKKELQRFILKHSIIEPIQYDFYFYDFNHTKKYKLSYNKEKDCICDFVSLCNSICENYQVLRINKSSSIRLSLE